MHSFQVQSRSNKSYFIDLKEKTSVPSYVRTFTHLLGKLIVLLIWTKQLLTFIVQTNVCPVLVHVRIHAFALSSVECHSVLHLFLSVTGADVKPGSSREA